MPDAERPQATVYLPKGSEITQSELNWEGYLDVVFKDIGPSGIYHHSISDAESEISLSGPGSVGAVIDGAALLASTTIDGGFLYCYQVTGGFSVGDLTITIPAGTFTDRAGKANAELSQTISVLPTPPGGEKIRWVNEDATTPALVWKDANGDPVQVDGHFSANKRAVIKEAIRIWNNVLVDLNNDSNVFHVTFSGGNSDSADLIGWQDQPLAAETIIRDDAGLPDVPGQPRKADVILDNDGGGIGWFVDSTPGDNAEFPSVLAPYFLGDNAEGQRDMLSVVVHELGHALGISINYAEFRKHIVLQDGTPHPPPGAPPFPPGTRIYNPDGLPSATLTPLPSTHLDLASHPFELMADQTRDPGLGQAGLAAGQRALVSPLTVGLLQDAFGYEVFFPTFDSASGLWSIEALPSVANNLRLSASEDTLRLSDTSIDGFNETSRPLTSQGSLLIVGNAGDDQLTVDYSGQNPIPDGGLVFDGGSQITGDSLVLVGGAFNDVIYHADPGSSPLSHAGAILSTAGAATTTIQYRNLEPITDLNAAGARTFISNIPGSQQIRLRDDGDGTNGVSRIDSNGTNQFETIDFANPANNLNIYAGAGNDSIVLEGMDPSFGASLELNGGGGSDTFQVTPLPSSEVFVDGGEPIGTSDNDALTVQGANSVVSFAAGPHSDEGVLLVDALAPVSFDNVDSIVVRAAGEVTIMGTYDADQITVIGSSPDTLIVTVNGGPQIQFNSVTRLIVDGLNGADQIVTDLGPFVSTRIDIRGGTAGYELDRLIVNGADRIAYWGPSAWNGGGFSQAGQSMTVTDIELLDYVGTGQADQLIVSGNDGPDTFVAAFGDTLDAGSVRVSASGSTDGTSLLPMHFANLGLGGSISVRDAVPAGGPVSGIDKLILAATSQDDDIEISFFATDGATLRTFNQVGEWIRWESQGIESYEIDAGEGDDEINVIGDILVSDGGSFHVSGKGSLADGDRLILEPDPDAVHHVRISADPLDHGTQDITGLGARIDAAGFEYLLYRGRLFQDDLTIDLGDGDNTARITRDKTADVVFSDSLPPIGFTGLGKFVVDSGLGADRIVFETLSLAGTRDGSYELLDGEEDLLTIRGTDGGNDEFLVVRPPDGSVAVTDQRNGMVTVTEIGGRLGRLEMDTLRGDDVVIIDVDDGGAGSDLLTVPITFDGGENSDRLIVRGTPAAGTTAGTYRPGPAVMEGRLVHAAGAAVMTIDFVNLEPVVDTVPGTLTVMGTDAVNSITYQAAGTNGAISVDAFESLEFGNKTDVTIDGLAGNDTISVAGTSAGFSGTLFVHGNEPQDADRLIVNGVAAKVTVDAAAGTIVGAGPALIDYDTIESLHVNAGASSEFEFAGSDDYTVLPGPASDQGTVLTAALPISFDGYAAGDTISVSGTAATDDCIVVAGSDVSDTFDVSFPSQNAAEVQLANSAGEFATWKISGIENYVFDGREGDDDINLTATVNVTGTVQIFGGGPGSGSDTLNLTGAAGAIPETVVIAPDATQSDDQTVAGLSPNPIEVMGIEFITYAGVDTDDALIVDPGSGDNAVRVERGTNGDWVVSDSLPRIEFAKVNTFAVDAAVNGGADVVTFATRALGGAVPGNYQLAGGAMDTLVIEGADGWADVYAATNPAGTPSVAVSDGTVTVTETAGTLGRLQVNTLGGNDQLDVNNSTGLIALPSGISFDGGTGSDLLRLLGSTEVTGSTYNVGPQADTGSVMHTAAAGTQTIFFQALEPVIDIVAGPLTVNATDADNMIDYRLGPNDGEDPVGGANSGLVSIDGFENLEFANKTTLTINALAGSDVVHLNNGTSMPAGLTGIFVNGGDPTASDTLIVNGLAAATVEVNHTGADKGTIVGAEPVTVTFETLEHVTVNARTSSRLAVSGSTIYTVNPGAEADQGEIRSSGVPIAFDGYGSGEFVRLTSEGAGADVTVNGTAANDVFAIAFADGYDTVTIAGRATVETASLPKATLNGYDGDDRFIVNGSEDFTYTALNLHGGDGDRDDLADLNGATGDVVVDLGNAMVTGYGIAAINYTGLLAVDADANGKQLTVKATSGDDETVVTPATATSGVVSNNGINPVVLYSDVLPATGVIVDQLTGGEDTLIVNATSGADTITVDLSGAAPFVNTGAVGGRVQFDGDTEAVTVHGLAGNDTFNVTSGPIPVFIDGGDPVGEAGDALHVTADTSVLAVPGPERDAGGFTLDGNERVSFDRIEAVSVTDSALPGNLAVTVVGTNGDDDLTLIGVGSQAFTVSVNDGLEVLYQGAATAQLEGHSGDDDIEVDLNNAAFTDVTIAVLGGDTGGDPSTDSDVLTVTGVNDAANAVQWAPSSADDGKLTVTGVPEIAVTDVEGLVYDGESDNETLTVTGAGRFVHIPGATVDAGSLQLDSWLGIRYVNLGAAGTVTADGTGETDMLVAWGTDGSDVIAATFTGSNAIAVDVTSAAGTHVDLLSTGVESYEIRSGAGDDDIRLVPTGDVKPLVRAAGTFHVFGDGDATRDTLRINGAAAVEDVVIAPDDMDPDDQDISGLGTPIDVTGIDLIRYAGADTDDALRVDSGRGDNTVRVEAAHPASWDVVTSDSLPDIEFTGLKTFQVDSAGGADVVTFATRSLGGAVLANYQVVDGDGADTLVIEGTDGAGGADRFTVTNPADGSVAVTDHARGNPLTVTATSDAHGRLQIATRGGDDVLTVNVDAPQDQSDLVTVPITFDGGTNSDTLIVQGTPVAGTTAATYTPGPDVTEGRLVHRGGAATMIIDFLNLEPVVDVVPGTLTVNGTDASNWIDYRVGSSAARGLVSVDEFETIEFQNKTTLTINALAGDDVVNLNNPNMPQDLDAIVVNGNDGDDRVTTLSGTPVDVAMYGEAGHDVLDATGLTGAAIAMLDGGDGDDLLVGGPNNDTLSGGSGNDDLDGGLGDDIITAGSGDDTIVGGGGDNTVDGGIGFDNIHLPGTPRNDVIDVLQASDTLLTFTLNGDIENDTLASGSVEQARVLAGEGLDQIRVTTGDALYDDPGLSLRMVVDGGPDQVRDSLVVVDGGESDLTVWHRSQDDSAGTVVVGPANSEPFQTIYLNVETVQVLDDNGHRINGPETGSRLIVFKHDPLEGNDDRFTATFVGTDRWQNLDPTIDPGAGVFSLADEDWFQIEAAVTGTLDVQVFFEEIAAIGVRPGLPGDGNLDIQLYDRDGTLIAGGGPEFGTNDGANDFNLDGDAFLEDERTRIPAVQGQTYFLRVFGKSEDAINTYNISVINDPPPVPYDLELDDLPPTDDTLNDVPGNSDTGRSQLDNTTRDNTPVVAFRLDDGIFRYDLPGNEIADTPPDEVIRIPFTASQLRGPVDLAPGYRVAVFVEGLPQQPGQLPQTPVGYARQLDDGVYEFDFDTDALDPDFTLTDGSHFISARVEMIDPADNDSDPDMATRATGWGSRSASLEIVVDTVAPPVAFGDPAAGAKDDGLHPDSDSGVEDRPTTFTDRVTRDTTPTFFGVAEADSLIRVYVDVNDNKVVDLGTDVPIGQTTATPLDGTNQFPAGWWELTSAVDMNDPEAFPTPLELDGVRRILVTAEDVAGNVSQPDALDIFIDTRGARVTDVEINGRGDPYDLFDPKPATDGPTPPVNALVISVWDAPLRSDVAGNSFLYDVLLADVASNPGHYQLVGDHSGQIAIQGVTFTADAAADGLAASGIVTLTFTDPGADQTLGTADDVLRPLPDDRYTLYISEAIVDPAGNALDGESNGAEPLETPLFSSGDGQPGGDFEVRFTVDSRPEFGTVCCGGVYVDINGDFVFDPEGRLQDAVNRDLVFRFGETTDGLFAGDFAAAGAAFASGFDKLGGYGYVAGKYRFLLDLDHDGVADFNSVSAVQVNAIPVAGDFAPLHPGDEIGLFDGTRWYLDSDGDNVLEASDTVIAGGLRGLPLVGNFGGSPADDLATLDVNTNTVSFDLDRDGFADDTLVFSIAGWVERILAGDVNLDGIDDLVFWAPGRDGQPVDEAAEWYVLVSDRPGEALPSLIFEVYSPSPLGNDLSAFFGDQSALPIFGNFDPPVAAAALPYTSHTNPVDAEDVDNDGTVSPLDALLLINRLNAEGPQQLVGSAMVVGPFCDPTGDGILSPIDVLAVISRLNSPIDSVAEGEAAVAPSVGDEVVAAWHLDTWCVSEVKPMGPVSTAPTGHSAVLPADGGRMSAPDSAVWAFLQSDDSQEALFERVPAGGLQDVPAWELEEDWDALLSLLAEDANVDAQLFK